MGHMNSMVLTISMILQVRLQQAVTLIKKGFMSRVEIQMVELLKVSLFY